MIEERRFKMYTVIATITGEIELKITLKSKKVALEVRDQIKAAGYDTKVVMIKEVV